MSTWMITSTAAAMSNQLTSMGSLCPDVRAGETRTGEVHQPMERLSGLDVTFRYLETPSHHMHVALLAMFDPSTTPGGYSFDTVKEFISSKLHLVLPFRRRVLEVP